MNQARDAKKWFKFRPQGEVCQPFTRGRNLPSHLSPTRPTLIDGRASLRRTQAIFLGRPSVQVKGRNRSSGNPTSVNQAINKARGPRLTGQCLIGIVPAPIAAN